MLTGYCNMAVIHVLRRLRLSCYQFGVVTLSICIFFGTVTAERTCGSDFDDVGSSTLLAPIVVEGRAKRVLYNTGEQQDSDAESSPASVEFDRVRLYKGQLAESAGEVRSIEVGHFGLRADREACVAPLPVVDRPYVLFLRQTDEASTNVSTVDNDARRQRGRGYRLSAFPVRKSRRTMATVTEYTNCSRCGRAPVVRLTPEVEELRKQAGQRLELRCRLRRGRPTPRFVWSRNGVLLVDRVNRIRIKSSRSRSKLQVRRLKEDDAGLYQCQALNVVGQSDRSGVDVVVVPNVEPTKVHSVICSDHSYCLNGGTCFIIVSLGRRYCLCQEGFRGDRCQEREINGWEKTRPLLADGVHGLNATVLLICGVVAAALTVVAIAIIIFASARRCFVERKELQRRCGQLDDSRKLLTTDNHSSRQQQQTQTQHHEQQVNYYNDDSTAGAGVVLRDKTKSNGPVPQSNRLSDGRRARLQATSATLDSEDLNSPGALDLWSNGAQHGPPLSSDNLRPISPPNGDDLTQVQKETTC